MDFQQEKIIPNIIFLSLLIIGLASLLINLFYIQIVEGREYFLQSRRIVASSGDIEEINRGLIKDRNGDLLAENIPVYSVYLDRSKFDSKQQDEVLKIVAKTINYDLEELSTRFVTLSKNTDIVRLVNGINKEDYFNLLINLKAFEGISIKRSSLRNYPYKESISSLIGYTSIANENDIANGSLVNSLVGRDGLEAYYENYLHKSDSVSESDVLYGHDLVSNIDATWQELLYKIIEQRVNNNQAESAGGVIMNSRTGEVAVLVSYPTYDNNGFNSGYIDQNYVREINNTIGSPLLNKAISAQLSPGSIFKTISASMLLQEGVINESDNFLSDRCMQLSAGISFCEADRRYIGEVNVVGALARSSNIFFCKAMSKYRKLYPEGDLLEKYAQAFGIGSTTGIDLPGETSGTLPSPELKEKLLGLSWFIGDDCNTVIGQGLLTVTPVQMVVAISAIQNNGEILEPHVVNQIIDYKGSVVRDVDKKVIRKLDIDQEQLEVVKRGMQAAAKLGGTAGLLDGLPGNLVAKTGSADAQEYVDGKLKIGAHSWVVTCFDYHLDNYCMVVMQQWGGRGASTVPIIYDFLNCLYNKSGEICNL